MNPNISHQAGLHHLPLVRHTGVYGVLIGVADCQQTVLNRRTARLWAAEIQSSIVVLSPAWAGTIQDAQAVVGARPSLPAIQLPALASHAPKGGLGGELQAACIGKKSSRCGSHAAEYGPIISG
jgi:hypothetical protein